MKPSLVDYKTIIDETPIVKKIKPKIQPKIESNINYTHIIFNLIGFLSIIIGFYTLYSRNKQKEENKEKYEKNIKLLNQKLNLIQGN